MSDNDNTQRKQPFMLMPSIESRIIVGILTFTGIMIVVFWVAINEPARMQEFTERSMGRSVENGGTLFESSCATCHGPQGYGEAGRAPALNNPQLFGYDFMADIDLEIVTVEGELEDLDADDPDNAEQIADLNAQLRLLNLERDQRYDDLRYNYGDTLAELETQLAALDARIEEADLNPDRLGLQVNRLQSQIDELTLQLEGTEDDPGILDQIQAAEDAGEDIDPALIEQRDALQAEIEALEEELVPLEEMSAQRDSLTGDIQLFQDLMEPHTTIVQTRDEMIALVTNVQADEELSLEDVEDQLEELQSTVNETAPARDEAFAALETGGKIVPFDPDADSRIEAMNWNGTLHSLIYSTIFSGRPTSASYWPQPMAAWSQDTGGPMRTDQIENVTQYILNWEREFTREDVRKIEQFARIPAAGGAADGPGEGETAIGTDVDAIVAELAEYEGDSNAGQSLYTQLGCAGCHSGGAVGPAPEDLADNAAQFAEEQGLESPTHYIVESIVAPNDFIATGYTAGVMPNTFGDQLTYQQLADIMAYLESFD